MSKKPLKIYSSYTRAVDAHPGKIILQVGRRAFRPIFYRVLAWESSGGWRGWMVRSRRTTCEEDHDDQAQEDLHLALLLRMELRQPAVPDLLSRVAPPAAHASAA